MKYRQLPRSYGTIRSRLSNYTEEENSSSRKKGEYESPAPYIPLDQRFYRYAGIQNPTITLDPQAYSRDQKGPYYKKVPYEREKGARRSESSSELERFQMESSDSSEDIDCHAHEQRYVRRGGHGNKFGEEMDSSFELSPYEGGSSDSESEEERELGKNRSKRRREYSERQKGGRVEEDSEELSYSGDSEVLRLKEEAQNLRRLKEEHQNHRRSINKIEQARNIVKEKLRTQEYERRMKNQGEDSKYSDQDKEEEEEEGSERLSSFIQSARFPQNTDGFKKQKFRGGYIERNNQREQEKQGSRRDNKRRESPSSEEEVEEEVEEEEESSTFRMKVSPEKNEKKTKIPEKKRRAEELIQKYKGGEFYRDPSPPKPILRKPKAPKSQERQTHKNHDQAEFYQVTKAERTGKSVKENHNPENIRRDHSLKETKKQISKPVTFNIDDHRDDLTLAQAFKIHRGDLRHRLKEQREQFRGHHQHQKKAKQQKKRHLSKTRTFMKNKFKNTGHNHDPFESQTRFTSPFAGRNNPLEEFKRMDLLRRRQLVKKYDKATRLRMIY